MFHFALAAFATASKMTFVLDFNASINIDRVASMQGVFNQQLLRLASSQLLIQDPTHFRLFGLLYRFVFHDDKIRMGVRTRSDHRVILSRMYFRQRRLD